MIPEPFPFCALMADLLKKMRIRQVPQLMGPNRVLSYNVYNLIREINGAKRNTVFCVRTPHGAVRFYRSARKLFVDGMGPKETAVAQNSATGRADGGKLFSNSGRDRPVDRNMVLAGKRPYSVMQ
jgi:hypothetical protein